MSGIDSFPESGDDASAPPAPRTQRAPGMAPTRGIEPPTSGLGPPPPPDFGIVTQPRTDTEDYTGGSAPAPPPQRTSASLPLVAIIPAIAVVLILVLGLVVIGIRSILSLAGDHGAAAPSSEIDDSGQDDPDQGLADSGSVESSLQAMIDEYRSARDNGSLWNEIPPSDFNHTALTAFLYLLIDMKLAASFGADTSDYLARADELEQKLLNQEPLGSDVTIKLRDSTFTYDGDTGEGGYTAN